jgi:hypothetical protein
MTKLLLLCALLGAWSCVPQDQDPGSETHWLEVCVEDGDCVEGECLCGHCTVSCEPSNGCELGVAARCALAASEVKCSEGEVTRAPRVCLPPNDDDSSEPPASATQDSGDAQNPSESNDTQPSTSDVGASVFGTLTLPATAPGKPFVAILALEAPSVVTEPTATIMQSVPAGTTLDYRFENVPPGTYFLLTYVDVDESGGEGSTPGDFVGWYSPTDTGNPPASGPNVVVPESGSVEYSFSLIER